MEFLRKNIEIHVINSKQFIRIVDRNNSMKIKKQQNRITEFIVNGEIPNESRPQNCLLHVLHGRLLHDDHNGPDDGHVLFFSQQR